MQWKCADCETINLSSNIECEVCGSGQPQLVNEVLLPEEISEDVICAWLDVGGFKCERTGHIFRVDTSVGRFFIGHDVDNDLIIIDTYQSLKDDTDVERFKMFSRKLTGQFVFFSMFIGDPLGFGIPTFIIRHQMYLEGGIPSRSILTTFQKCVRKLESIRG